MRILYIGQITVEEKINQCTAYSVPGDMFQKNILNSLSQSDDYIIDIVSADPNSPWPKDRLRINEEKYRLFNKMDMASIAYINIPIVKQFSQRNNILKVGYKLLKQNDIDVILVYNMYPQFGWAALRLSKKINKPLVAILADFPNDANTFWGGKDGIITKIMNAITWRNISKVKHGILLNVNARRYMAKGNDAVIIPGGVDNTKIDSFTYREVNNRDIIYAGALTEYSGVINLIEAVRGIGLDDLRVKIYGSGPLEEEIKERTDESVSFCGSVPIEEMRNIMKSSWLLINPRSTKDFVSTVTFPSKLFEYISCCRPVMSTAFSGIPDDIKDNIWSCGDGTPEEIRKAICDIYAMDGAQIEAKVNDAYRCMTNTYSWTNNGGKIRSYMEDIEAYDR